MQTAYNIVSYKHKPRLGTALELLRTTNEIEQNLEKVCLFLDSMICFRDILFHYVVYDLEVNTS